MFHTSYAIEVGEVNVFIVAIQPSGQWRSNKVGKVHGAPSSSPGTKLQRNEWNGEVALGGLSLHFCPGAPEFQVTPLHLALLSFWQCHVLKRNM